jgi:hypothetical protein
VYGDVGRLGTIESGYVSLQDILGCALERAREKNIRLTGSVMCLGSCHTHTGCSVES